MTMRLVLPYPPTANLYWRNWRGRMVVSNEAREYKSKVSRYRMMYAPLAGEVVVEMKLYRPARRGDLDNSVKVLLDALKGVAYDDDKQVARIVAARFEDKQNPRVEVTVEAA